MPIADLVSAVTTVGFPIVCCGAMMWYVKYTTDKHREMTSELVSEHREEVRKLNEEHSEEMKHVTEAIHNNTLALQRLSDLLTKATED